MQEGLSSQQVLDVAHDKYGFIWIATELGLNRFSSNSFKQYYKSEKADGFSVNSNEINTIFYDNDQLYIGTRANGLNVLDMKTNRFSYYLHDPENNRSIATNDITDIIKSKSGKLWLATYHQGVQRFDPVKKQFERFNKAYIPSLPENSIWTLAEDEQGLLYIGHVNKGISIFNSRDRSIELIDFERTKGRLPDNEVKALFCDSKNNIWIGTRKGLAVYNPFTKKIRQISLASQAKNGVEPFVYAVKEINGAIWVGTESSQAGCAHDNFNAPESMLSGRVVYDGRAVGVRNNGPQLQLWQDGYPLKSAIPVYLNQDGTFSASLFDGQYKLVRKGDSPWLQQATDTVLVNVKGNTNIDVPVTPYFTITGDSFQKSGNTITARFVVNKVVPSANVELVRLYMGKSILTDQVQRELRVDGNIGGLVFGQQTVIAGELPDNLKNLDYVYVRLGIKSTAASEYLYTPIQKIALK